MLKKLTRHGNSYAMVIDRPILELLEIEPDKPLQVSTNGKQLVIGPARGASRRKKFEEAKAYTFKRYGRMLKRLAK